MSTTMFIAARPVGIQGRLSAKKVRVSSRLRPPKGRLTANQNSAIEVRWVERAAELPALVDQPHDRRREHHQEGRGGDQQQVDLAHPDRQRAAHARARRAAPPGG